MSIKAGLCVCAILCLALSPKAVRADCERLAQGFEDVVPKRADTVTIVGQDFDSILESGFMTFAVYENFPPYSWADEGAPKGIDIDIAREIAEEIGVEARFNFFAPDENVDADFRNQIWKGPIVGGAVSNVMMHAPYNKDLQCRNEFVVLGGQYFNEKLATAYKVEVFPDGAPTPAHYRFHKVGVENHTISAFYLESLYGGMLLPNIVHYPTHRDAFAGMTKGEVDAAMGMRGVLEHFDNTEDIAVETPPLANFALDEWTIGIAVNFRYRELYYTVDGIIADMIDDGRMQAIFNRYGVGHTPPRY